MNCMKCGKEIYSDHVFCDDCREVMDKYPVNPNTPVVLPRRSGPAAPKKVPRRKSVPLEEQIVVLKSRVRLLAILLTAVSILAALLVYPAVKYLMEDHFLPGQNYTSIVSKSSAGDASDPN